MKEREAKRREQILKAVIERVSEVGIDGVTMRGVAEKAGVSTGMVTYYYANKRELILDALKQASARRHLQRRVIGGLESNPRRMGAYYDVAFSEEEGLPGWQFMLEYWSHATRDPDLYRYHLNSFREGRESMAGHIRAGIESGELRDDIDPEAFAEIITALRNGLGVEVAFGDVNLSSTRARELAERVLSLLRAPAAQHHNGNGESLTTASRPERGNGSSRAD